MSFKARSLNNFLTRVPEKDFTDDGFKFIVYTYKNLFQITYTTYKGTIYLAIDEPNDIPYSFISDNPEFRSVNTCQFNGIDKNDPEMTIENVQKTVKKFADLVVSKIRPAWEIEKASIMTEENISKVIQMRREYAQELIEATTKLVSRINFQTILKINDYDLKRIKNYYQTIMKDYSETGFHVTGSEVYYDEIKSALANNFKITKPWQDIFYFKDIKEILEKIGA